MKNARVFLLLAVAIVCGLAAGYAALRYLSDRPPQVIASNEGATVPVVLAGHDMSIGDILGEDDLIVVDWPAGTVPTGFASSKDELIGRNLVANVQANEPILASKLAEGLLGILPLIPPGMRAMSVAVNEVVGVAGFVTPQTFVDVILIMKPPGGSEPVSKIILQHIQALAAAQEIRESETGEAIVTNVVTVLVSPEDAEKLSLAEHEGAIRLALRNTSDVEEPETPGERVSRLFAGTGSGLARPTVRVGSTTATTRESIMEIYRGGVRTLISY